MLKLGKSYRIQRGKVTTGGNHTMLSISESTKNQQTGEWENGGWWSLCVNGQYPCEREDGVRFTPSAFTAISQRDYNGKTYYTIFADGDIDYKGSTYKCGDTVKESAPKNNGFEVIGNSEDLPF